MRHLSDDEMATVSAGLPLEAGASEHLNSCLSCRSEIVAMKSLIDERRELLISEAPDWDRQRQNILERLPEESASAHYWRWKQPIMALAASLVIAIGISVIRFGSDTPQPITTAEVTLEDILAETESLLEDDSIPGLWVADPISDVDDIETLFGNGAS